MWLDESITVSVRKGARSLPALISRIKRVERILGRNRANVGLLVAGFAFLSCLNPLRVSAEGFGPFPVRNFNPLQQLVLNMPGDRAATVRRGTLDFRLELAETAAVYYQNNGSNSATVKIETLRNGLYLRYGATDKLELSLEIPILYRWEGFMEGMIQGVERATTGLSPARQALNNTNYVYTITRGGQQIVNGKEGALGFGDSTVTTKYQLISETSSLPTVSVRAAIKIPTGNESEFFGSGSPDFGLGLALEKSVARRWVLYGNLNGVMPTGRIAGLALQPTISGLVAAEYLWTENLSLTVQFDYYSTPFKGAGLDIFDKGVTEVAGGFSYRMT